MASHGHPLLGKNQSRFSDELRLDDLMVPSGLKICESMKDSPAVISILELSIPDLLQCKRQLLPCCNAQLCIMCTVA